MKYTMRFLCWKLAELSLRLLNIGVLIAPIFLGLAIASAPGLILQALGADVLVGLLLVFVMLMAVHIWIAAPYIWPAALSVTKHLDKLISERNHEFWLERNHAITKEDQ